MLPDPNKTKFKLLILTFFFETQNDFAFRLLNRQFRFTNAII
jgi:hypothetical protein